MNVEAIKLAREIMEAVPEERVDMSVWHCGTHACLLGHMALSGKFPGLELDDTDFPVIHGTDIWGSPAGRIVFDLDGYYTPNPFLAAFSDAEMRSGLSDKAIALARLDALLAEAAQ